MATDDEWLMVKKLSDDELRSELIKLNVSYLGPINCKSICYNLIDVKFSMILFISFSAATRTANERKLIQLSKFL